MTARPRRRRSASGIVVAVTDARGRQIPDGRALGTWLAQHAPREARGTLNLAIVSDATMRRLNRQFRGKNKATDVLSFLPGGENPAARGSKLRQLAPSKPSRVWSTRKRLH